MQKLIKLKVVCEDCNGTGLYRGMCEHGKSAVICYNCNGKGYEIVKHKIFKERKYVKNIERVFKASYGCNHTHFDTIVNGKKIFFSKLGCSYTEFLLGIKPKPVEDLYCPFLWTDQKIQNKNNRFYNFYMERCDKILKYDNDIHTCSRLNKEKCWTIYYQLGGK